MSIWAVAEDHGKWEPPEEFGYYTDESLAKQVLEKLQGSPHRKYYIYPIEVNEYIDLLDKNLYAVNVTAGKTSISKLNFGSISGTKLKQVVDPGCRGVESRYCYVMAKDESEALAQAGCALYIIMTVGLRPEVAALGLGTFFSMWLAVVMAAAGENIIKK